ncbi:aspartate/glutamate racemase family protein [Bradyrhizobium ontarionense]|uniref:Aspartate/glutamate racemase family protein n=1 Tax=Bradyrhizobium ontarionense TaxID=2898149 RepID=A0ABY3RK80_9BRAD|nr:aspartate/glutamate racemase family protein [Bradyrhizobium sp. A19]UFZ07824.1 aspartate/glutamate racemase family protein [Bradyrhizobium sp. A19]
MTKRTLLGMLTPSSNTALEPITSAMVAGLPNVSAHFSRFKVTEIALSTDALAQFDTGNILRAAELLAHAKVDVIGWNGTSSGWLGFETDVKLCEQITAATGIPATTSMLALNEILTTSGVSRLGYVTPYRDDVQAKIIANYEALGISCGGDRHLGLQDNFSFAEVTPAEIETMIREVAREKPDAIAVICTNMRAAPLVARLELETGIPILDTIATVVWKSLKLAGADISGVSEWGSLFHQFA